MIRRICVFTFSYSPNRQAMIDYLEKIFPPGIELFVFASRGAKNFKVKRAKLANLECSRISSVFRLRKFCKNEKIERVFSLGLLPYEAFPMAFASFLTKTDFVCYQLGNPIEGMKYNVGKLKIISYLEFLSAYVYSVFSKKLLFCSQHIMEEFLRYIPYAKKKSFYLPTTIPTEFFRPLSKKGARKKLGIGLKEKVIIFVARIGYLKGADIMLELIKRNPQIKFILIGDLVDKTFENHNFLNMALLPRKSPKELVDYYNAADLCVFPSRIEGVALVPREAMSCKTPAIVLDTISSKTIKKAIKVPENIDLIDKEVKGFFNLSKEKRENLKNESRDFIVKNFDDKLWVKEYIQKLLT